MGPPLLKFAPLKFNGPISANLEQLVAHVFELRPVARHHEQVIGEHKMFKPFFSVAKIPVRFVADTTGDTS